MTAPPLTDGKSCSQNRGHDVPTVTPAEAQDDAGWFRGTRRRYRLRRTADGGGWIIRRRAGGILLRSWAPALPDALPDNDEALRPYWYLAAYPELPAAQRHALIQEARQQERA
jgi:hypothetical protein